MAVNRRDLIRTAILGSGAALSGQAQHTHATPAAAPSAQAAANAAWKPLLFDEHQNQTVIALTELIIPQTDTPGAKAALVNRYIDLILNDGDSEPRVSFLEGLGWLDGYSIRKHNAPFVKLSAAQQTEILETLDGVKLPEIEPGARFFSQIKRLTVDGYYTSKIGIDELNKGGRVPSTFACQHAGHA